jgi:glutathione S-transferase
VLFAQRFPNAELAPLADPFALAQVQEFNSYLCSTVACRARTPYAQHPVGG